MVCPDANAAMCAGVSMKQVSLDELLPRGLASWGGSVWIGTEGPVVGSRMSSSSWPGGGLLGLGGSDGALLIGGAAGLGGALEG